MLKPPVQIFVAYGHNHLLRDLVSATLLKLAGELGFRVMVKVVTDSIVRTGTGAIGSEVHKALRDVDAAIILLTSDDYAISREEFEKIRESSTNVGLGASELIRRMERRARQNVVYEIGYLNVANFKQDGAVAITKVVGTIIEVTLANPILPKQKTTFSLDFEGQVPLQIRRSGKRFVSPWRLSRPGNSPPWSSSRQRGRALPS
jgi:hypothetical protein